MFVKDIFNRNRYFFIPFLLVLIFVAFLLITCQKSAVHIFINSHHTRFLDLFFKYLTNLGDGLFAVAVGILLLFVSIRKSLFVLTSYLTGGLFVQILKRLLFSDTPRPVKFFEGVYDLYFIEGLKMRKYLSFPSGHAATAFGLFLCLAVISRNNTMKTIWLFVAVLVAFSRVYLSQHFLTDVYFGSLIGVACTLIMYRLVYLSPKSWPDKSLLTLFKKK